MVHTLSRKWQTGLTILQCKAFGWPLSQISRQLEFMRTKDRTYGQHQCCRNRILSHIARLRRSLVYLCRIFESQLAGSEKQAGSKGKVPVWCTRSFHVSASPLQCQSDRSTEAGCFGGFALSAWKTSFKQGCPRGGQYTHSQSSVRRPKPYVQYFGLCILFCHFDWRGNAPLRWFR